VVKGGMGATSYVDFERIRKHDGYVYYWTLGVFLRPSQTGALSLKQYIQGDCKLFRFKGLSYSFHNKPMGEGTPSTTLNPKNPQWHYPPPNSKIETVLNSVCAYAK
jgi:hypothetical protein